MIKRELSETEIARAKDFIVQIDGKIKMWNDAADKLRKQLKNAKNKEYKNISDNIKYHEKIIQDYKEKRKNMQEAVDNGYILI